KIIRAYVVPNLVHKMLLGMDFAEIFNVNLDFSSRTFEVSAINSIKNRDALTPFEDFQLEQITKLFRELDKAQLGKTSLIEHEIDTGNSKPFRLRQYPLSPAMFEHLNKEIDEMLTQNIIRPSISAWSSP